MILPHFFCVLTCHEESQVSRLKPIFHLTNFSREANFSL